MTLTTQKKAQLRDFYYDILGGGNVLVADASFAVSLFLYVQLSILLSHSIGFLTSFG